MNNSDNFGDRMKGYENTYRLYIPKRLPVIIRIDGCHFHQFTKGLDKPFDEGLSSAFWETGKYMAREMGAKLVYHQSDEISILLTDYDTISRESWFKNNLQKMISVSASMATAKFNEEIKKFYPKKTLATFDSRIWVLPHDEVCNYFLWRQQDASKNSISMVAQNNFKHEELQKLNSSQLQEKLFSERGINWNDLPVWQKRGICIKQEPHIVRGAIRMKWEVDHNTPIFSKDRIYVNQFVYLDKEVKNE